MPLARIEAGVPVVKLITAPVRQQERGLPLADTGEFPREIGEVMGDKVDDFALTLNATTDRDHAGGEDDAAIFFERLGPHDEIGDAGNLILGVKVRFVVRIADEARSELSAAPQ